MLSYVRSMRTGPLETSGRALGPDLARGFIAVQTRLNGEPLEEYLKPQGGGYFFVLPGVTGPDDFLGRSLLA